jgi:hypothetical protein
MVKRPTKYRARTAPIAAQPDMFGGPRIAQMRDPYPCDFATCSAHGSWAFCLKGARPGPAAMTKYFCDFHRAHGEAHWRMINAKPR